jgi:TonB family protein
MFQQLTHSRPRQALWVSLAVHCVFLYLIVAAAPRFVQPSSIAFGNAGSGMSTEIVYVGPSSIARPIRLQAPSPKEKQRRALKLTAPKPEEDSALNAPIESARAGSLVGSSATGATTGYESRPALPVVFPNPAVDRSDIPSGVAGDVVVEVTIDEKGNVADTKVLESLGYGLEDKVLEALKNWRFTPATMNGIAIASRQDVHFHFPS